MVTAEAVSVDSTLITEIEAFLASSQETTAAETEGIVETAPEGKTLDGLLWN